MNIHIGRISSKVILDLNVKVKRAELLEDNVRGYIHDLRYGNIFKTDRKPLTKKKRGQQIIHQRATQRV